MFHWLCIDEKRSDELFEWVKFCWKSYNTRAQESYTFSKMLRNVSKAALTPEELFIGANMLGRMMAEDCNHCVAKDLLAGILLGHVDIQKVDLTQAHKSGSMEETLKERIKKDVN